MCKRFYGRGDTKCEKFAIRFYCYIEAKHQKKRDGKALCDIDDIICLLKETDPERIPIFVARDLQKLPPVLFDHVDVTRLLKDLLRMQNEIKVIKEQYVTKQDLNVIKYELNSLKNTAVNPHINTKRGGCILSPDSESFNCLNDTILAVPESPLLHSSILEGNIKKQTEGRSEQTGELVVNIKRVEDKEVTHRAPAPSVYAPERATALRHTVIPNGIHVAKQQTYVDVLRSSVKESLNNNDGWTLVQKRKRFTGN